MFAGVVVWGFALGYGWYLLGAHTNTPGAPALPPRSWPVGSRLRFSPTQPTLLLFAHPKCPCTRATINELATVMAHCQGRVQTFVLFVSPDGVDASWSQTEIRRSASAIPAVMVVDDPAGREAGLFNSRTSGQMVLYDTDGTLAWSGGITMARGHAGDNPGRATLITRINQKMPVGATTPVFGCALCEGGSARKSEEPSPVTVPVW